MQLDNRKLEELVKGKGRDPVVQVPAIFSSYISLCKQESCKEINYFLSQR